MRSGSPGPFRQRAGQLQRRAASFDQVVHRLRPPQGEQHPDPGTRIHSGLPVQGLKRLAVQAGRIGGGQRLHRRVSGGPKGVLNCLFDVGRSCRCLPMPRCLESRPTWSSPGAASASRTSATRAGGCADGVRRSVRRRAHVESVRVQSGSDSARWPRPGARPVVAVSMISRTSSEAASETVPRTSRSNSRPITAAVDSTRRGSGPRRATRWPTTSRRLCGSARSSNEPASAYRPVSSISIAPDSARCRRSSPTKNGFPSVSRRRARARATPASSSS